MEEQKKEFKIRDLRKKDQYKIDDAYLNGYSKLCSVYATAVYNSLSRHADFDTQQCFPSIELIAEQHNISKPSVIKGIKELEKWSIVRIIKGKDEKTKRQLRNTYILLDKNDWKPKPSQCPLYGAESMSGDSRVNVRDKSRVNDIDCKDNTEFKDNTVKVLQAELAGDVIPDLLKDKQKHIQIIGLWAKAKKIIFTGKEHQGSFIRRNLRAAQNLVPYDMERIMEVMAYLIRHADFKASLESVGKYIDDDLSNLSNKSTTFV
uniref:Putative DNA binding, helix-turn-helix domain containing protein n=1 Tax=viral metagenome TaxID=1070528 RepID=A0A6H1ZM64_9ZZZZ